MRLLEGKVAVVTGAGRGLGRAYALALAAEGARVIVNDTGVELDGTGGSHEPADSTVAEIVQAGGAAVANYDSVDGGAEAIVQSALDRFGGIDILVNNAGIVRDKTILKMTDEMWDAVAAVHLRGAWACLRAAARAMKARGSGGHIINTTSIAGLKGHFGQANYGAAKAGVYGLTLTAALELAKEGITVNAVAPMAKTRMTKDMAGVPEHFLPVDAAPMVVFLASDLAKDITGRVFGVHGRHVFEYRMETTEGWTKDVPWTPSEISARVHGTPSSGGLVGRRYATGPVLVRREAIAAYDDVAGDPGSLLFPVVLARPLFLKLLAEPEIAGDLSRVVHGEQVMIFHRKLTAGDIVSPRGTILSIDDKPSGRVLNFGQRLYSEGELAVEMESRLFFRTGGGGGKPSAAPPPARGPASSTHVVRIPADLPARYAAAADDRHMLHVDAAAARAAGFKDVILHGLCTLALAARTLPKNLSRLEVRFRRPVYPGDLLTTSVWQTGDRIEFETVNDAGECVLSHGAAHA